MGRPVTSPLSPRGFSLLELMVVVAVLGALTVGGTLLAGRSAGQGESDAQLFKTQFQTLHTLAITGGQTRGLRMNTTDMRAATHTAQGWQFAQTPIRFAGRAVLSVSTTARQSRADAPDILFLSSGRHTPFTLTLGTVRCETDGWSGLTCSQ
jgi:type II secretion system protein H